MLERKEERILSDFIQTHLISLIPLYVMLCQVMTCQTINEMIQCDLSALMMWEGEKFPRNIGTSM